MLYLLDTNILIHAHDGHAAVRGRFAAHAGNLVTSVLCVAELRGGLHRRPDLLAERRHRLDLLLSNVSRLPFDMAAVGAYDDIIARRGFVRSRDFDRMIAGHAISVAATLVTDNATDFADIPGLEVENWTLA